MSNSDGPSEKKTGARSGAPFIFALSRERLFSSGAPVEQDTSTTADQARCGQKQKARAGQRRRQRCRRERRRQDRQGIVQLRLPSPVSWTTSSCAPTAAPAWNHEGDAERAVNIGDG